MVIGEDVQSVTQQFISRYNPYKLFLFGSQAKERAAGARDIDICVITEAANKRHLLMDMYLNIDSDKPLDILLYTPEEWNVVVVDNLSFAHKINKEGIMLYARH